MNNEQILKNQSDARVYSGEKPKYKDLTYFGEQQVGSFILTDQRILFLRKTSMARTFGAKALELAGIAGLFAGLPAALLLGDMASGKLSSAKINSEEVEKILREDLESMVIPLRDVVEAEARRAYMMTAYLMVKYNTAQDIQAVSFVFGTAAKNQKELANAIEEAKKNLAHIPVTTTEDRIKFCINCGEKIPVDAKFCPKCGDKQ